MEQRNLLLAIVLSVGILIGFQFLFEKLHPPPPTPPPGTQPTPAQTTPATPAPQTAAPGVASPGAAAPAAAPATHEVAIAEQPRVKINTPRLHGSIALISGRIPCWTPP